MPSAPQIHPRRPAGRPSCLLTETTLRRERALRPSPTKNPAPREDGPAATGQSAPAPVAAEESWAATAFADAVAAVALGATVIEKHFTLARAEGGVDSAFSLEPAELSALVDETERAWQALGEVRYGPTDAELASLQFRRSIYVAADIAEGEIFTPQNLRIVRPGFGAPPYLYDQLMGLPARRAYQRGTPLCFEELLQH